MVFVPAAAALTALLPAPPGHAAPPAKDVDAVTAKAYAPLKAAQNDDGSFAPKLGGPGVTALVVAGLIRTGKGPTDPVVAKALAYLGKNVQSDGGIYSQRLANYTTCVALMAFKEANTDGKYDTVIAGASGFLKGLQAGDDVTETSSGYGGVGYDGRGRPDLSNTHFFVEALLAAGVSRDDPAIKKAIVYVGRCQNLKTEHNPLPFATKTAPDDKGGFVYTPTEAEGKGKGGKNVTPDGGLRSYGSMSYAGLKSLLYAGVGKDDPRVKEAVGWVRRHYSAARHPGQGDAGLYYYYYHLFAKGLDAYGETPFVDVKGARHDWRQDLFNELRRRQSPTGTRVNTNRAFGEDSPELCTAFALLALGYCRPDAK
ncbi:terpene cyclase/mutase family protein [bacterium]|nr:terpene cyclase/mutase family protein [bacterium]